MAEADGLTGFASVCSEYILVYVVEMCVVFPTFTLQVLGVFPLKGS